ncbi:MAG: type I-B CRISPR-associated protein Cas8b1/Cst1 [Siphonobacter aquaeclarae]|nr:type I-B CRISPR-associated protein Cas8b1/Cst1 [Siphonobacter aquaeclarae]
MIDDFDLLTRRTGEPFADTGGSVIACLHKRYPTESILDLIDRASQVYVDHWKVGPISTFFLNSKITQPAFDAQRKKAETRQYFAGMLDGATPGEEGYCRILGEKTRLYPGGRDNFVLGGSGTFVNFHHFLQPGVMLSKEALIRHFFVPLGVEFVGNRVAVLASNDDQVNQESVEKIVKENFDRIGSRSSDGVKKSKYKNPANALFEFVNDVMARHDFEPGQQLEVSLYYFTNFGASPEIELYRFSAALFEFYRQMKHFQYRDDWQRFAGSYYRQKGAVYDSEKDQYVLEGKKPEIIGRDEFSTWYNSVYRRLIQEESLLPSFVSWAGRQWENQQEFEIYHVVTLYQTHLTRMQPKTLQKIEEIAELVIQDESKVKRRLTALKNTSNESEVRRFLLQLIEDQYAEKSPTPVITLRGYVNDLFPDGTYGREVRDLLLISVYEKLTLTGNFFD